jgi:hypothetical protein
MPVAPLSWPIRLVLAGLSGVLSGLALMYLPLPQDERSLLQGAVFGALVLVPFLPLQRWCGVRSIALIAGGGAIQLTAARLARYLLLSLHAHRLTAISCAGVAGSLLVGVLARTLIPLHAGWRLWTSVTAAGLVAGVLLGSLPAHAGPAWIFGLVAWQVLVCAALCLAAGTPRPAARDA